MDLLKDLTIDNLRNAAEDAFNQAKPKSEVESRVYECLSHKNWGSSSTIMNEIARDTYDYDKFPIITKLMWESMENQRPAAWRVVFKGLTLLEHLVKNGSERCVDDARNHGHILRGLHQFNYYEGTVDRGLGVKEKSKQIVEILGDDERIREERGKAKKLREKFGGSLGGVGSGGSGGGGGGGGKYGGYGNDSGGGGGGGWDRNSGGGGYGDSGLDSGRGGMRSGGGGGGGGSYGGDSGGFSGRYADEGRSSAPASNAPTFATIPDSTPKKKGTKKKKKKKPIEEQAPAQPEVDLFSFDDPTPSPVAAPVAAADDFGDFTGSSGGAAAASAEFDAFGSFKAAPAAPAQQNAQFDAFAAQPAPVAANNMGQVNDMFGQMNVGNPGMMNNNMNGGAMMGGMPQQQQAMMGGMPQQQQAMMGGMPQQQQQFAAADDDFGDFEDAAPKKAMTMTSLAPVVASDPLSKLISLDSLEKNKKQAVSTMGQPITANSAAMQYVQNNAGGAYATPNPSMSFQNIDGLGNTNNGFGSPAAGFGAPAAGFGAPANGFGSPAAAAGGMAMGSATAGGADVIAMMGPVPTNVVTPQQQQQQQRRQQQQQYQGMPGGFPQKQQQGGMQQQGNMGMMNPQMMQQQQANMTMQGGMQQQGNMGMMNPQMMQQGNMGGMNNMQGGMPQQGMGGMPQQGMQGNMMGGNMPGGNMGGQPMQGWR